MKNSVYAHIMVAQLSQLYENLVTSLTTHMQMGSMSQGFTNTFVPTSATKLFLHSSMNHDHPSDQ